MTKADIEINHILTENVKEKYPTHAVDVEESVPNFNKMKNTTYKLEMF